MFFTKKKNLLSNTTIDFQASFHSLHQFTHGPAVHAFGLFYARCGRILSNTLTGKYSTVSQMDAIAFLCSG